MSLRKSNLHYMPREISQSERRLYCRNLFLAANEKWCTIKLYQISHFQWQSEIWVRDYVGSRHLTTFSTPWGLKRYTRLNFGTVNVQEVFHEEVRKIVASVQGAKNIADEIIVYWKPQSYTTKHSETLQKLKRHSAEIKVEWLDPQSCQMFFRPVTNWVLWLCFASWRNLTRSRQGPSTEGNWKTVHCEGRTVQNPNPNPKIQILYLQWRCTYLSS